MLTIQPASKITDKSVLLSASQYDKTINRLKMVISLRKGRNRVNKGSNKIDVKLGVNLARSSN